MSRGEQRKMVSKIASAVQQFAVLASLDVAENIYKVS